ncbi:Qat anti-phage system QueC-like protein QatC [Pantanalinema rosaneae CENA516]|uniref:Qat anti-phage system QueC-like protein QatC n=1 Tax=Pantanalinema rosaneae TaxID=1620701 RepID=UPI003D6F3496
MSWHLIVKIGTADTYSPVISSNEPRLSVSINVPGDPFAIKNNLFKETSGRTLLNPSSLAIDLLNLALGVYTADLKIARNLSKDRWTRDLVIHLPVVNLEIWLTNRELVQNMLSFLTGDRWKIQFRQHECDEKWYIADSDAPKLDTVCLFSGGLDSLVGAIDILEEGKNVALISHHGAGMTQSFQQKVLRGLEAEYGNFITSYSFYVQPPKRRTGPGEPSMRSRSILFLAMGTFVASLFSEAVPLVVAENGLISLNVCLTSARLGSLSTRTTHPHFISLYQELLDSIGLKNPVELPYQFQTKGEMFKQVANYDLLSKLVDITMSCSHPESGRYLGKAPGNHCGYCVPCIIRRASLAAVGLDKGIYNIDILKNEPSYENDRGRDYRAFQMAVERYRTSGSKVSPFDVLKSGPLPPESIKEYMEMYSRGMDEVLQFLENTLI